jgi:NAD(P)-dependent dehydrogenase (short-subunit alcohol dehydrogenase family)
MPVVHDFDGKVALVTGAASGIGAATARLLVLRGARVTGGDLVRPEDAEGSRPDPDEAAFRRVRLDVTLESDWEGAVGDLLDREGRIDVLVHSAGISAGSPLHQTDLTAWRRVLEVNLDGTFLAVKHGIAAMGEHGGSIVLLGSASGIRPSPGAAAYSTSKAAVSMLARTAAKECRATGLPIRINVVSPAGVKTPMWEAMPFFQDLVAEHGSVDRAFAEMTRRGGGRFAEPGEIAEAIAYLSSDAARHVTGVELAVDDGYTL